MRSRKFIILLLVIAVSGTGLAFLVNKRRDVHHTKARREWKNEAVASIRTDLLDPDHLKKRFGKTPAPETGAAMSEAEWLTSDTIVCSDSSWLAYRGQCHKEDPKVHDIFIARASDGRWYYSDYHFCKQMLILATNG